MNKENDGLQELIKDLEVLMLPRKEKLLFSSDTSFFEVYNKGYREGLRMILGLAKNYLNTREED